MRLAIRSGTIIPVLLMLPNVAWMLLPNLDAGPPGSVPVALGRAEHISRAVVLALPCFLALDLKRRYSAVTLSAMGLALGVYYAAWGRFFVGGGPPELLAAPLLGIPSPLVFAPVAFLLIAAYVVDSWWMLGASAGFGALHVWAASVRS